MFMIFKQKGIDTHMATCHRRTKVAESTPATRSSSLPFSGSKSGLEDGSHLPLGH